MKNVMNRGVLGAAVLTAPFVLTSCLMERTVTDGSGQVIYSETEAHMPFESDEQKEAEVDKKERELGWQ